MTSNERLEEIAYGDDWYPPEVKEAMIELLAHRKAREGWKLVPVEPTAEMVNAGKGGCVTSDMAREIYEDMLAASPEP